MSILPGFEAFYRVGERSNPITAMLNDLAEQAHDNFLKYLAAAATTNVEEAWHRFRESFALEQDIDTLITMYEFVNSSPTRSNSH